KRRQPGSHRAVRTSPDRCRTGAHRPARRGRDRPARRAHSAAAGDRAVTQADDLLALDRRHVWHPFTQAATAPDPIPIRSAQGARLVAADGREYLDLISSWWVTLHGHAHPVIAAAVARQAAELEQVIFAGFTHGPAIQVAARVSALLPAGLERVFYSDDGSTSVEVALKLAYQYWWNRGEPRRHRFLA